MARVVGAFGVHGWVRLRTFSEAPDALARHPAWVVCTARQRTQMALEGFEVHAKGPVAKLAGCGSREAAEALRGAEVAVPREALGEAGQGEIYRVDLVGLEVVDESGASLGRVAGFLDAGDAGVMVVEGAAERLIPFVADYVKAVDREAGRITVDWKADYDA